MDSRLEIFTLGGVRILRGGEPLAELGYRQAEALGIYLASTRRFQPGEVLADLFATAALNPPAFQSFRRLAGFSPMRRKVVQVLLTGISTRQLVLNSGR